MAGIMFQEVVSPRTGSHRSWYTLAIAFVIHTAILVALIVAPLVATDVLPAPRQALQFISSVTPVMPSPPPVATRAVNRTPEMARAPVDAPLVAPDSIGKEIAIVADRSLVETDDIRDLVIGFGDGQGMIEAAPPAPPVSTPPVRVGGDVRQPKRIKDVAPAYPQIARDAHIEGIVIIQATIGTDGRVENAEILRPKPFLDEAALAAVRQWEYTPTLLNGVPTRVIMTVTVQFKLN